MFRSYLNTNPNIEISLEPPFWPFGRSLKTLSVEIVYQLKNFASICFMTYKSIETRWTNSPSIRLTLIYLRKGCPCNDMNVLPWMSHTPNSTWSQTYYNKQQRTCPSHIFGVEYAMHFGFVLWIWMHNTEITKFIESKALQELWKLPFTSYCHIV